MTLSPEEQRMDSGYWSRPERCRVATIFGFWPRVEVVHLIEGVEDAIRWSWEKNGLFSVCAPYAVKFVALQLSPTASFTWQSKAPLQCHFFSWLALKNHCWTSDRLAIHDLPHQESCPFCDQANGTINHLMMDYVFTKEV
mgnify:CR=1 FL=1